VIDKFFEIKFNILYYDVCANKSKDMADARQSALFYLSVLPNFQDSLVVSYKKKKKPTPN